MAVTYVVIIPALGILYMDLNNALTAATHELNRMRNTRNQIVKEFQEFRDANTATTKEVPSEE
jgi:hypothetical protein